MSLSGCRLDRVDWPSLKVPQEHGSVGVPLGPTRCPHCNRTGIPEPVATCLGDLVLRVCGWCKSCRNLCCVLEPTHEVVTQAPPWKFLSYDQRLPQEGVAYPSVRRSLFDVSEFPFGHNEKETPSA